MANLLLGKPTTQIQPPQGQSIKKTIQPEVIEISSDDDTNGEQKLLSIDRTSRIRNQKSPRLPTALTRQAKKQKVVHNIDIGPAFLPEPPQQDRTVPHFLRRIDGYVGFDDFHPVYPLSVDTGLGLDPDATNVIFVAHTQSVIPGPTTRRTPAETPVISADSTMCRKKVVTCPYYQDTKLDTLMYRGPGHEDFPVVFGTDQTHQQVLNKWDEKQALKATRGKHQQHTGSPSAATYTGARLAESSDEEPEEHVERLSEIETLCLSKVREILPDIQQAFVVQKMRLPMQTTIPHDRADDLGAYISVEEIVMSALEHVSYPKEKKMHESDKTVLGKTVPLLKGDPNNNVYRLDCVGVLALYFERVPTYEINKVFLEKKSLYDAYLHIEHIEENYYSLPKKPYKRLQKPRTRLETKYQSVTTRSHLCIPWRNIVNELQAARQQVARERIRATQRMQDEALEAKNLERHRENGSTVECRCCFDGEVALNRVVGCEGQDIHWFCFSCVESLAESQLGIMRYEMMCMDGSGCKAPLNRHGLTQAVPIRVLDKLDFLHQHAEIMAAGIEGLEQCEYCEFQGICDPIDEDPVFRCRNPECGRTTCRKCHEDTHLPKTCEEVNQERGLSARHVVEEARSEAMMRVCPGCKVKIVKESGCNKIVCTKCHCMSCFVCKEAIMDKREGGYQHFNAPGAKCSLYDKDFDRHDDDANKAEKETIAKIRAGNSNLDEKQLQVEANMNQRETHTYKVVPGRAGYRDPAIHAGENLPRHHARAARAMQDARRLAFPVGNGPQNDFHRPYAQVANHGLGIPPAGGDLPRPATIRPPLSGQPPPGNDVAHLTAVQEYTNSHRTRVRRAIELGRAAVGLPPALNVAMLDNAVGPVGTTPFPMNQCAQKKPRTAQALNDGTDLDRHLEYNLNLSQHPGAMNLPHMQHDFFPCPLQPMADQHYYGNIQVDDNHVAPIEGYDIREAEAWLQPYSLLGAGENGGAYKDGSKKA